MKRILGITLIKHDIGFRSRFSQLLAFSMICCFGFTNNALADSADAINQILAPKSELNSRSSSPPQAAPMPANGPPGSDKERWIEGEGAIDNLQLITGEPGPGDSCRKVIFNQAQAVPRRYEPRRGETLKLQLDEVCWIALRNGSNRRAVVLRVGEAFETLAIIPSPQLSSGLTLKPNEQIRFPLRQLNVGKLAVSLEVIWEDRLDAGQSADALIVEFVGRH